MHIYLQLSSSGPGPGQVRVRKVRDRFFDLLTVLLITPELLSS